MEQEITCCRVNKRHTKIQCNILTAHCISSAALLVYNEKLISGMGRVIIAYMECISMSLEGTPLRCKYILCCIKFIAQRTCQHLVPAVIIHVRNGTVVVSLSDINSVSVSVTVNTLIIAV